MDETNKETFHRTASIPRFVTVYASDFVNGRVSKSDMSGAVVRRCYDVVLNDEQRTKFDAAVDDAGIYEEDSCVFVLGVSDGDSSSDGEADGDVTPEMMLDKFDYIKRQIDKIDHPNIDNDKLTKMMLEYYQRASA